VQKTENECRFVAVLVFYYH